MRTIGKSLVLIALVAVLVVVLNMSSDESEGLDCVENKVNFDPDEVTVYCFSDEIEPLTTINLAERIRVLPKTGYCNPKINGADYNQNGVVINSTLRDSGILVTVEKKGYSIEFRAENIVGTEPEHIDNIRIGDYLEMPEITFSRTGYDMVGWNTRNDLQGESLYDDSYDVTGSFLATVFADSDDIILYPIWATKNYSISLTTTQGEITEVQWTKNDNTYRLDYTIESEAITLPSVVTDDRFHYFVCWEDQNGNTVSSIPTGSHGDISLNAVWALKEYNMSINVNGETISQTCTLDSTLEDPDCEEGFSFIGWFYKDQDGEEKEFTSMSQMYEGMSIYAVFEPIKDDPMEMAFASSLLIVFFSIVMVYSFRKR